MMLDSTNVSVDRSVIDVVLSHDTGYPLALAAMDTYEAIRDLGAREFPEHLWIEQKDWKDWAKENDRCQTWPENFRARFTNQSPSHECVSHSFVQNFEIAWNRTRKSTQSAVFMSPLSVYAEANPRRWGGTNLQYLLGIAMKRGVLPDHCGPAGVDDQRKRFKHTLIGTSGKGNKTQTGGEWVSVGNFPDGWEETAKHFRPLEVINPASWEQIVCLILHGICVCVGRSGHAIPYVQIVWDGSRLLAKYADSYDIHRYDSVSYIRSGVGGSYAIVSTTVPDDWSKPVG